MKRIFLVFIMIITVTVFNIAPVTAAVINGSSIAAYKHSVSLISQELNGGKQRAFEVAASYYGGILNDYEVKGQGDSAQSRRILNILHGQTADQIIDMYLESLRIRLDRAEKQALEAANGAAGYTVTDNFKLSRVEFYFTKANRLAKMPVFVIKVQNDTPYNIIEVEFYGRLFSPSSKKVWAEGPFTYMVSGGIRSGARGDWELSLSPGSDWAKAPETGDLMAELKVIKLTTATGAVYAEGDRGTIAINDIPQTPAVRKLREEMLEIRRWLQP